MPLISLRCPHCDASLEFQEGMKMGFCMYCGNKVMLVEEARKVEIDNSAMIANWKKLCIDAFNHGDFDEAKLYVNKILEVDFDDEFAKEMKDSIRKEAYDITVPRPDDSLMAKVEEAVVSQQVIDFRTLPFDRAEADGVLKKMFSLESLNSNEKMVYHYTNACAIVAMTIRNCPDPYLIRSMLDSLNAMYSRLMAASDMWGRESNEAKNRALLSYKRNVDSLLFQIKDVRISRDPVASRSLCDSMMGNTAWTGVAKAASDAFMTTQTSKWLFGESGSNANFKIFKEYAGIFSGRRRSRSFPAFQV